MRTNSSPRTTSSTSPELRGRWIVRGHKQLVMVFRSAFPDWRESVEDMIAEGDKAGIRVKGHGTHEGEFQSIPPTGTRRLTERSL